MSNNLTLSQVLELLDGRDFADAMLHADEVMSYAERVDDVATDILNRQSLEFSKGMIGLAQSMAISIMIFRGDLKPSEQIRLIQDESFLEYSILLVKMVVGISAMEELR